MDTNCAPLIEDLFLNCYESQFMTKIQKDPSNQDLVDKLNITYLHIWMFFLALNNPEFQIVSKEFYLE